MELSSNNLFPVDSVQINEEDERDIVVNLYKAKIAELNAALSKIQLQENNTALIENASKNSENINPNGTYNWLNTYIARVQYLQSIYNELLRLRNGFDIIFNQCNSEYNNMSGVLRSFYTQEDILNLNQRHKKTIEDFYRIRIMPQISVVESETLQQSGGRRNYANNTDINMKDIRELCKANQIKLSRVVNDKSIVYTKKELITKLKRKKLL